MFTGIIEEVGKIGHIQPRVTGARLTIECNKVLGDLTEGSSMAVNGVCLTAIALHQNSFAADLSPETLKRSNLGDLPAGSPVNLERPLLPTSRISGHFVQGHVDGTGEFLSMELLGDNNWSLKIRVPQELECYLVWKGSIAIDGISLTIALLEADVVSVAIIPHTYENTTLRSYRPGARVNLECDVIAKHIEKLMNRIAASTPQPTPVK